MRYSILLQTRCVTALHLLGTLALLLWLEPGGVQGQQIIQAMQIVQGDEVNSGRTYNGLTLPDNRELRRQFEAVRRQLESDNRAEAVRRLGMLLAAPKIEDFFLVDSLEQPLTTQLSGGTPAFGRSTSR